MNGIGKRELCNLKAVHCEHLFYQKRFLAKALPDCDLKYFSNCFAQPISLNAVQVANSQGLSFLVWIEPPELCKHKVCYVFQGVA